MANSVFLDDQIGFSGTFRKIVKNKAVWLLALALPVMLVSWYYQSVISSVTNSARNSFEEGTVDAGMVVQTVQVTGLEHLTMEPFVDLTERLKSTPILSVNIEELYNEIANMPWVKSASVSRVFPDQIAIEIIEREPFALWQMDGEIWLVDSDAHKITDQNLGDFSTLPFLVGDGAPQAFSALVGQLMADPSLLYRIASAVYVGERRWDIVFDTGARLRLPENSPRYDAEKAWVRFSKLERDHQLLARDVAVYDVRLPDRMVVSLTDAGRDQFDPEEQKNERAT